MRDSNVQLHHDRILGYPCVNLCMQSSIHVIPFIFLLRKFLDFFTYTTYFFIIAFLLLYITLGKWDNLFVPFLSVK